MVSIVEAKKQVVNPSNWEEVDLFCKEWWEELKQRLPAKNILATIGQHGARVEDDVRILIFYLEKERYQFMVEPGSKKWGLCNMAIARTDHDLLLRELYLRSCRENPNLNLCLDVVLDRQRNLVSLRNTLPWIKEVVDGKQKYLPVSVLIFQDAGGKVIREMQRGSERYRTDLESAINLTIAEFKLDLVRLP